MPILYTTEAGQSQIQIVNRTSLRERGSIPCDIR